MKKYEFPEFHVISLDSGEEILSSVDGNGTGGVGGDADTGGGEEED